MSTAMRILLFAGSVLMACYVLRCVRRSRIRTEDSLFWIIFSLLLLFLAIVPSAAEAAARWLGVISTVNLVYLVIIFVLIVKILLMDQKISRLEVRLTRLLQDTAIERCGTDRGPAERDAAEPCDGGEE